MEIFKLKDMVGGWFIGNFEPSVYRTALFEVCYKEHIKNEKWETHYHKEADEINYLISGTMLINGIRLTSGDIFLIKKNEISKPEFLENCSLIVVKAPSVKDDKYEV